MIRERIQNPGLWEPGQAYLLRIRFILTHKNTLKQDANRVTGMLVAFPSLQKLCQELDPSSDEEEKALKSSASYITSAQPVVAERQRRQTDRDLG